MAQTCPLPDRAVLSIAGEDRVSFLQGLISNDVAAADGGRAVFAALLTPQGKFLFDFFLVADGDRLLLDCHAGQAAELLKKLKLYKLRAKVTLADLSADWAVAAVWGDGWRQAAGLGAGDQGAWGGGYMVSDPRHPAMGARGLAPRAETPGLGADPADPGTYDRHRLGLGVPDGARDLEREKSTLLEANYDALNAISWSKGCYIGQELTARTKYRGLLKKRLFGVKSADGAALPDPGTAITAGEKAVGEMRSSNGDVGIALIRLEAATGDGPLSAGGQGLALTTPA